MSESVFEKYPFIRVVYQDSTFLKFPTEKAETDKPVGPEEISRFSDNTFPFLILNELTPEGVQEAMAFARQFYVINNARNYRMQALEIKLGGKAKERMMVRRNEVRDKDPATEEVIERMITADSIEEINRIAETCVTTNQRGFYQKYDEFTADVPGNLARVKAAILKPNWLQWIRDALFVERHPLPNEPLKMHDNPTHYCYFPPKLYSREAGRKRVEKILASLPEYLLLSFARSGLEIVVVDHPEHMQKNNTRAGGLYKKGLPFIFVVDSKNIPRVAKGYIPYKSSSSLSQIITHEMMHYINDIFGFHYRPEWQEAAQKDLALVDERTPDRKSDLMGTGIMGKRELYIPTGEWLDKTHIYLAPYEEYEIPEEMFVQLYEMEIYLQQQKVEDYGGGLVRHREEDFTGFVQRNPWLREQLEAFDGDRKPKVGEIPTQEERQALMAYEPSPEAWEKFKAEYGSTIFEVLETAYFPNTMPLYRAYIEEVKERAAEIKTELAEKTATKSPDTAPETPQAKLFCDRMKEQGRGPGNRTGPDASDDGISPTL